MGKVELKSCPFCGGEADVESETCGWRVKCIKRNCYTSGPWPDDCTEAEAIEAWNTRTTDQAKDEEIARYRAALEQIAGFDYEHDDTEMQIVCADVAREALGSSNA